MNTEQIEEEKLNALTPILKDIQSLDKTKYLSTLLGHLIAKGLGGLVHFSVHPDLGDSHIYSGYLEVGAQGLPEREFYLDPDEHAAHIRDLYQEYIIELLHAEGIFREEQTKEIAQNILALETELARHTLTKEERRQIDKLYNPHTQD